MSKIGAIILAAGLSKRMGQPKLLLSLKGKPLFRYPLEQAIRTKLNPICLIGGQHIKIFQEKSADLKNVKYIHNPNYDKGMSTSIKIGIEKMIDRTDATFIFLADQPFVPDLVIEAMMEQYRIGTRIVRPKYQDNYGHPILIDKSLYDEFLMLDGDQGGKVVIKKYENDTRIQSFDSFIWGQDIDTPEDFKKANYIAIKR